MSLVDIDRKMRRRPPARILTIDIERLPGKAWAFDQRTNFIPYRNFIEPPRTICWAARWLGQSRMMFRAEWLDPDRMVTHAWELFDQADAVISFNGIRFDMQHLRGMWLTAGLKPPRPWKNIDLYRQVKQFGFLSNSLDYTARQLGFTGKTVHYSIEMAHAAVSGDKEAQRQLRAYNSADVELTEFLHERLLGWMPNHPHMGRSLEQSCNQCGSTDLEKLPSRYRAVVLTYDMFRCQDCGGIVRANFNAVRVASTTGVR